MQKVNFQVNTLKTKFFKYKDAFTGQVKKLQYPVFFPDATRGVVRALDTQDVERTQTEGLLVNTYHLYKEIGFEKLKKIGSIKKFMDFKGAMISDSGGFQVGSLIKKNQQIQSKDRKGKVTDEGVMFWFDGHKILLTPEESIKFQMELGVDMVVALDDFDAPNATDKENLETVNRTINWAKRSKEEFEKICKLKKLSTDERPYILGVVQGGKSRDLRKYCIENLIKIGFDGLGYGGEEKIKGQVNYDLAKFIADAVPDNYLLYALGVGKPQDVVAMSRLGYHIFDCVLPTRDARHKRLYVYNFDSIDSIKLNVSDFYSYYQPDKKIYSIDNNPVSLACDCLLCTRYTKSYLYHLFKINDFTAARLASIHNLRFYSILMSKIRNELGGKLDPDAIGVDK